MTLSLSRRPAEAAALELAVLKKLIAGICHEINNPLTAVQGLADLIAQDCPDPQTREDLVVISRETERAISVVRALRSFARSAEGEAGPCSLNTAVTHALASRAYELRARGISAELVLDQEVPSVSGHPEELASLALALLLRAEQVALGASPSGLKEDRGDALIFLRTGSIGKESFMEAGSRSGTGEPKTEEMVGYSAFVERLGGRLVFSDDCLSLSAYFPIVS